MLLLRAGSHQPLRGNGALYRARPSLTGTGRAANVLKGLAGQSLLELSLRSASESHSIKAAIPSRQHI
jgi:hypothetical protein